MTDNVYIAGIDIGLTGGFFIVDAKGNYVYSCEMPIVKIKKGSGYKREVDVDAIKELFTHRLYACGIVYMEKSRPFMKFSKGVRMSNPQANFSLGRVLGILEGMLQYSDIPYELIDAKVWQKTFGIASSKGDTKKQAYVIASRMFSGDIFKTERGRIMDGVSDAALIAEYGRRKSQGGVV